ncbi:MAG: pyruvate, phosphate dikinase [Rickettsiaceae bacterium H1]|nr:pyruvate, phosphate dikinase [Rickettsiaceae bacterium H1]
MKKVIYTFSVGESEGYIAMKELLGGKGANLAEMCRLKLPVPPGFTITAEVCTEYYNNNRNLPDYVIREIDEAILRLERKMGKTLGDKDNPMLLSVRSGSKSSMPGMMDTILNLGINEITVNGIPDKRFAYDSYRRFIQMYGSVVLGINVSDFEKVIGRVKADNRIFEDIGLTEEHLLLIVKKFKELIKSNCGEFIEDVKLQLINSVKAVFDSWMSKRAISYRKINGISENWGTAVNVQAMVFGNLNESSGSGVAFTRNPSNGEKELFGEYLLNAQGEDVVSGIRTPKLISENMKKDLPEAYQSLLKVQSKLEEHYRDMQDVEFTVQDKKLWVLQTRSAKRTVKAAIKVAMDMLDEGLITKEETIVRIEPSSLEQLIHPVLDETSDYKIIARGLPAAPGAVSGIAVFSIDEAIKQVKVGKNVILVRKETSPEDIEGMNSAVGILTTCGGMTSHAAVVSRGMGKVCVCGTEGIVIDYEKQMFITKDNLVVKAGEIITLDGNSGRVILGEATTNNAVFFDQFHNFMKVVSNIGKIDVRANADNVQDVKTAKFFGVDGIGLCRTEHMFFSSDRINLVRKMIISETRSERLAVLSELEKVQTEDFTKIFREIGNLPVTIRLLDPPLHEFLPHDEKSIRAFANNVDLPHLVVVRRINKLKEVNPMLGHRGCRVGISYPEIYEMQVRSILASATAVPGVKPEIMVPFVMNEKDFCFVKDLVEKVAWEYLVDYSIGNMIELPSAALNAEKIGAHSEFFSFGTNDLTQMTMGLSRDDSAPVLNSYCKNEILKTDPFASLQQDDVGELMKIAIERGKKSNSSLKIGICGEHAGDPKTVHFCAKLGLDYVSCSPYRVLIARLSAAQYVLLN